MDMAGIKLEEVGQYRYLGVHIDDELNFNVHIRYIIKNVAHKIYLLCKVRSCLTKKAALDVFKVMILPLLDVGDVFYHGANQTQLNKIELLQKRAIRIVSGLPRLASVQEEIVRHKVLPLWKRRKLHLAQLARWMAGKSKYLDVRPGNTRSHAENRIKLNVIYPRKSKIKKSFLYQSVTIWNDLPTYLNGGCTPEEFKKGVINSI